MEGKAKENVKERFFLCTLRESEEMKNFHVRQKREKRWKQTWKKTKSFEYHLRKRNRERREERLGENGKKVDVDGNGSRNGWRKKRDDDASDN